MTELSKIVRQSGEISLLRAMDELDANADLCHWAAVRLVDLCKEIDELEYILAEVRKVCNEQEQRLVANSQQVSERLIEDMKDNPKKYLT